MSEDKLIFSAIKLEGSEPNETSSQEFSNYYIETEDSLAHMQSINNLSKVNVFVGENNSGKSRFLRELSKIKSYMVHVKQLGNNKSNLDTYKTFSNLNVAEETFSQNIQNHINRMNGRVAQEIEQKYREFLKNFSSYSSFFHRTYIPINRGFIRFSLDDDAVIRKKEGNALFAANAYPAFKLLYGEKDLFGERTARLYNLKDKGISNYKIATGYDFYSEVKKMLLGDTHQRKVIADFQNFLSKYFYEDHEVLLIPNESSRILNIKIGDDEQEVHMLGDGIQNIVHILYEVFTKQNALFFIEEPELMMHPGMQRRLMEILLSNDIEELKGFNHQFFITTHSNHLLDLTLDYNNVSVYKFSSLSEKRKKVEQVSFGDKSILQELGVQNSSVFLANKVIWVEGISDRNYIRKYLNLYIEKHHPISENALIEDIDYVIAEYQGSNIEHWLFEDKNGENPINIERLCSNSMFIADTDASSTKTKKHVERTELLGKDRYLTTPGREIENTLSIKSISQGISGFVRSAGFKVERENESQYMTRDGAYTNSKYRFKKIGSFIDNELNPTGNAFAEKTTDSTIKSGKKNDFSFNATKEMLYDDLTNEAIEFTKKIYDFIKSSQTNLRKDVQ